MSLSVLRLLRPSAASVRKLAFRETDPQEHRAFEPIVLGAIGNGLILAFVALCAIVTLPFRVLLGGLWKR